MRGIQTLREVLSAAVVFSGVCLVAAAAPVAPAVASSPAVGLYAVDTNGTLVEFNPGAAGDAVPAAQVNYEVTMSDAAMEKNGTLYITDLSNSVLQRLPTGDGEDCACPTLGGATGLDQPYGVAVDSAGHIWVTNVASSSVEEFARNAVGNVKPLRTISGGRTGLSDPGGIAVDSAGNVFVADSGAGSVEEFAAGAHGNSTPAATIAGASTTLQQPAFLAFDSAGNLWVTDTSGAVDEFAPGSFGNVAPAARIAGSRTGLRAPRGIAVDSTGAVYVICHDTNSIREFAPGAHGNAAPTVVIKGKATGLAQPEGLLLAPAQPLVVQTDQLPVGHFATAFHARLAVSGANNVAPDSWSVLGLPAGLRFNATTHAITGAPTRYGNFTVVVKVTDSASTPHVAQTNLPLAVEAPPNELFLPSGTTNAISVYSLPIATSDQAPVYSITGPDTGLDSVSGVALGPDATLYVSNSGNNSVTEYAFGATGDAVPTATIQGADTGLDTPGKLTVDGDGCLFVTNNLSETVTEYAPGASGDAAPVASFTGFDRVGGVAAGGGQVFMADSEANTVNVYTDSAGSLAYADTIGGADTGLNAPTGLAVDESGLFAADAGGGSITSYPADADGDMAPTTNVSGSSTGLDIPAAVGTDNAGLMYVANLGNNTVTEYGTSATGDMAPIATLSGPDTEISAPESLAVLP